MGKKGRFENIVFWCVSTEKGKQRETQRCMELNSENITPKLYTKKNQKKSMLLFIYKV